MPNKEYIIRVDSHIVEIECRCGEWIHLDSATRVFYCTCGMGYHMKIELIAAEIKKSTGNALRDE